jgi:hypothetical protein
VILLTGDLGGEDAAQRIEKKVENRRVELFQCTILGETPTHGHCETAVPNRLVGAAANTVTADLRCEGSTAS